MTGEELRTLMVDGRLPEAYISEENLVTLRAYEREEMAKADYYDMSVIIYCDNLLVRRYNVNDKELVKWWSGVVTNIKNTTRNMIDAEMQSSEVIGFATEIAAKLRSMSNDEELRKVLAQARQEFEEGDAKACAKQELLRLSSTSKERTHLKWTKMLSTHLSAIMIAVVISVPFALAIFNLDGIIYFFSGSEEQHITQVKVDARTYSSVEEFEIMHDIRLLVPTWLPGDLEVTRVEYGDGSLDILYTNDEAVLIIELNAGIPDTYGAEVHERNGIVFYIFAYGDVIGWVYDGNFYNFIFGFDISEYAVRIIENIK